MAGSNVEKKYLSHQNRKIGFGVKKAKSFLEDKKLDVVDEL